MVEAFVGRWKLTETNNFDEYMKKLGVGLALRTIGNKTKPTVIIESSGNKVVLKSESTFKNTEISGNLNEAFEETTPDGRTVQTTLTLEDGKLVQRQKAIKSGEKDSVISREIKGAEMHVTCTCEDVVCHRILIRQTPLQRLHHN